MSTPKQSLSFTQQVEAPPDQIYRAFTNSTALREWLSDEASSLASPGGRLYLWWSDGYYACGEYVALELNKEIQFTWRGKGDPAKSQVEVTITEQGGRCEVHLEHTVIGEGKEWEGTRDEMEKGWQLSLENLVSVLETGKDLRFVRRPMLGITLEDFNAEIAEKLGIPVSEGIRIDGVIEGMGAEAAGLQPDDVMVGLAGKETTDWPSLTSALQSLQAGEEVEVVVYRGEEKKSIPMKLSGRPIPEIPNTPQALSKEVDRKYQGILSELEHLFEKTTEEQAAYKPAEDVWSAKEHLAHLIHAETGTQVEIQDLVIGFEPIYDGFGGNPQARIEATLAVYPTVDDLLKAFQRSCDETVAFLAHLPYEFVARKGSYWRLAYNLTDRPYHFNLHLEQMRYAIEAAG
jgi:uncharacterized protein YndB with AHSA1/START domain